MKIADAVKAVNLTPRKEGKRDKDRSPHAILFETVSTSFPAELALWSLNVTVEKSYIVV